MTPYVSRAGQKLDHALRSFQLDVRGKVAADFGCSTGGFTDCLLQHGAVRVYAVDTAYGVLDWKLRQDPRVVVKERTNALHIELPERVDVVTVDVSWTKQRLIVPRALAVLAPGGCIVSLVKPHYEAEPHWLVAGRMKDEFLQPVLVKVESEIAAVGGRVLGRTESPIAGEKGGNREYLFHIVAQT